MPKRDFRVFYSSVALLLAAPAAAQTTSCEPVDLEYPAVCGSGADEQWIERITSLHRRWERHIDTAGYLKELQDAGVPVFSWVVGCDDCRELSGRYYKEILAIANRRPIAIRVSSNVGPMAGSASALAASAGKDKNGIH